MRIALGLEYDGASFCGWQTQPDGCAVQDALELALTNIATQKIHTVCAGRTDAGVHALCQVVHFDCEDYRPITAWTRGVNTGLPPGISVLWAREVTSEFHARYSALSRHYKYFLLNRGQRPGLLSSHVGWFHAPLNVKAMHEAAQYLAGEHDFSAFRAAGCQAKSPVRTIAKISVSRLGDIICFQVTANAFLHHMIRNIVGSLVYVGCGRQPSEWIAELLQARDRRRSAPTFSANGLYLSEIRYAADWRLPQIASVELPETIFSCLN